MNTLLCILHYLSSNGCGSIFRRFDIPKAIRFPKPNPHLEYRTFGISSSYRGNKQIPESESVTAVSESFFHSWCANTEMKHLIDRFIVMLKIMRHI